MVRLKWFCWLLALVCQSSLAFGQTVTVDIDLDWTGYEEQEKLSDYLREKGELPLPLVLVDGKLAGLLPARLEIPDNSRTLIEIGVSQIAERPLYVIDVATNDGKVTAHLDMTDLGTLSNYKSSTEFYDTAISLKDIVKSNLLATGRKENVGIRLPAAPYATFTGFAGSSKTYRRDRLAPVVMIDGDAKYEPVWPTLSKYNFDRSKLLAGDVPEAYKQYVDFTWVAFQDPFEARPLDRIQLNSMPSGAGIYINGYEQAEETDFMLETPENLWRKIVLRKEGYRDCPLLLDLIDYPDTPDQIASFTCSLQIK